MEGLKTNANLIVEVIYALIEKSKTNARLQWQ
jgi:hypothetical protein